MVCPLCEKRKAKRDCPAKGTKICSICCGSEREVTIDCPFECRYLQESRQREYKGNLDPKDFPSKEIRIDQSFLREHAELLNVCGRSLLEGASETPGVADRDTQEALGSPRSHIQNPRQRTLLREPAGFVIGSTRCGSSAGESAKVSRGTDPPDGNDANRRQRRSADSRIPSSEWPSTETTPAREERRSWTSCASISLIERRLPQGSLIIPGR